MTRFRPWSLTLPMLLILVGVGLTPPPGGGLWLTAPLLGAVGYLGNRSPHRWGWAAPILVGVWLILTGNAQWVWGWMLFGVVASVSLLGLASHPPGRKEKSLWGLSPLLLLVVLFPLTGSYVPAVEQAVKAVTESGEQAYESYRALGIEGAALTTLAEQAEIATERLTTLVENLLPALLFVMASTMVAVGALLARRLLRAAGRPGDIATPFAQFRMPEFSEWILVLSLATVALGQTRTTAVGLNVGVCLAVGYWLQGLAVTYFAALKRGLRPGLYWVLFLFVAFFALPVLLAVLTLLGLADVWLDLRRLRREQGVEEQEA